MKKLLPHIEIGLNESGAVTVSVEDFELFDFVDDYVTIECDLDWKDMTTAKNEQGEIHIMHFHSKHGLEEIERVLLKLSVAEIERIYALNS